MTATKEFFLSESLWMRFRIQVEKWMRIRIQSPGLKLCQIQNFNPHCSQLGQSYRRFKNSWKPFPYGHRTLLNIKNNEDFLSIQHTCTSIRRFYTTIKVRKTHKKYFNLQRNKHAATFAPSRGISTLDPYIVMYFAQCWEFEVWTRDTNTAPGNKKIQIRNLTWSNVFVDDKKKRYG